MDELSQPKKIHVIGVAGSVMGGMACLLSEQGHHVEGSDRDCYPPMSTRLERAGIQVHLGFDGARFNENPPDIVLVGNITSRDNPEAVAMRKLGIPHMSLPEMLNAMLLRERKSLTIAGTHGKTTTTSMVLWLLQSAGKEPGFMVGGIPMGFETGFKGGEGEFFVLEADEYDTAYFDKRPKFVHYLPDGGILTSVEFDHADIYPDFEAIKKAFRTYTRLFPDDAPLWVHAGNQEAMDTVAAAGGRARLLKYGIAEEEPGCDLDAAAYDVKLAQGSTPSTFKLRIFGEELGTFSLPAPGRHNIWNATAAVALVHHQGVEAGAIKEALAKFPGVHRRQELRGVVEGVRVIQDYAHHPTAVRETIRAIRAQFPDQKLWALFEAESNTSRRNLFQESYVAAFEDSDEVVFVKPLEKNDNLPAEDRLDAGKLASDLKSRGVHARFIPEPQEILHTLISEAKSGDIILFMSGRNFLGLPAKLVPMLKSKR